MVGREWELGRGRWEHEIETGILVFDDHFEQQGSFMRRWRFGMQARDWTSLSKVLMCLYQNRLFLNVRNARTA